MLNLTTVQKESLFAGKHIPITITVNPVIGDTFTVTDDDIIEDSINIDRTWAQGNVIEIGCADAAELEFELDNSEGQWNEVTWEGAQLTTVLTIAGSPVQVGIFTVDERPAQLTTMQIRALDHMARFNRPWVPGIFFPATLKQILLDACAQCNVTLGTLDFPNDDYVVDERPIGDDITCHHIVSWVAELAGSNAEIDPLGLLRLSWYGDNQPASPLLEIGPDDRIDDTYQMAENDITITGVMFAGPDADYLIGEEGYTLVIEDNPLLQDNIETVLNVIYARVGGFTYRPYEFDTLCYPHLWPGDVIQELTDADGNVISSIITNHNLTLNNKSELKAVGETETVRGYATGAPFTASQKRVLQSVARVEASRQVSSLEQATLQLNELMVNSLGFYTTAVEQPSGGKIVYTHDKPVLEESQVIWTQTELGFAWTDQGWNDGNPVWQYGVTGDGNMVIKVLTAIGINADWINVGKIRADLIQIGAGTDFATGYDPTTKATPDDVSNAESNAKTYAEQQAAAAQAAAEAYAAQKAEAERVIAEAYADGIVDAEEQARIDDVNAKLATAKTYAEQQAAAAEMAAKAYAAQRAAAAQSAATSLLEQLASGTYTGGSFIDGTTLYSPAVVGMTGAFVSLLAGNPSAAHLQLGESDGNPYLQMYDANNKLRVTLDQEYLKFTDPSGANQGYIHAYDGRMNIYTNTTAVNSRSWIELWGDSIRPDRQGEIIMGADHFVWRIDGSTTSTGTDAMRLNADGSLSILGNIARGDNGRLNFYTNTTSKNSWAWMEFWGYDPDYGRSGEIRFGGSKFTVRLGSTDTSAGVDKLILDNSGLNAIDGLRENGTALVDKYAGKSHTHSYLPLSGGIINGNIIVTGRVRANSYFQVGTAIGITQEVLYTDRLKGARTMQFTGGILTSWT